MKIKIGETYTNKITGRKVIVRSISGLDVIFFTDGTRNAMRVRDFKHYYTDQTYKQVRMAQLENRVREYQAYATDYANRAAEYQTELDEWRAGTRDNETWAREDE